MTRRLDIQQEKKKNLDLVEKALADARDHLEDIEKRLISGEDVNQETVDRIASVVSRLEQLIQ